MTPEGAFSQLRRTNPRFRRRFDAGGRVSYVIASVTSASGVISSPEGASRTDSRREPSLRRHFLAGGPFSYVIALVTSGSASFPRRKGDSPRIPPPRDSVAGQWDPVARQRNPIDTHSSCECVSTWARHRFVYECVSVEKDAGIPLPGRQDSVAGQWNPGRRAAEFRSGRGYAEKFNFSSLYSARSASLPIN